MSNERRVVITGMGIVSSIGLNIDEYWNNLLNGVSGIDIIKRFDPSDFSTQIAGELKNFNATEFVDKKLVRRLDEFCHYSITSINQALEHSGINKENVKELDLDRAGILCGSGIGGISIFQDMAYVLKERGYRKVSPFFIPALITNMAGGISAIEWGFRGPNYSISTACATSNHTLSEAYHILKRGDADLMVAGGTEAPITDLGLAGFIMAKALSSRNDEPAKASRPFDKDRDGFVMSEGSAILILETEEHAKKRGAKIYAEFLGAGQSCDANHMTAPCEDGSGAALGIKNAINSAGLKPEQIDYINSHGTSTILGDIAETKAIKLVFGDHAKKLKINAVKSMTGHMLGAAGAAEAISAVKSIETGKLHPTINLDNPEEGCDLDYVPHKAIEHDVDYAISNSFGFGGHNCTLVFGKYK